PPQYALSPHANTNVANAAYAPATTTSPTAPPTVGACTTCAGTYPTNPAGTSVNSSTLSTPPNSGSGYTENVITSSNNCRAAASTGPSQNAALLKITPLDTITTAPAIAASATIGAVVRCTAPESAIIAIPDTRSPTPAAPDLRPST